MKTRLKKHFLVKLVIFAQYIDFQKNNFLKNKKLL
jgi:hypothetical protein